MLAEVSIRSTEILWYEISLFLEIDVALLKRLQYNVILMMYLTSLIENHYIVIIW